MRILLDTNVLVALEDTGETASDVARLAALAHRHGVGLLVHPGSFEDFGRDRDIQRQAVSISKAGKYALLDDPPEPSEEWTAKAGGSTTNPRDLVDNRLLYAIERNCAAFLVTEDKGAHRKAARLGLTSVYYVSQAVDALTLLFERIANPPTIVEERALHALDVSDAIFGSLRHDYPEFDDWFGRVAREGRQAWVVGGAIGPDAICIFKEEDLDAHRALKLCTFKVGEGSRGRHFGELLLKTAFGYCLENRFDAAWVEVRPGGPDKAFLIQFLETFGFTKHSALGNGDLVYVKHFVAPVKSELSGLDFHVRYAPAIDWSRPKFVVPIQPEYHEQLFPEAPGIQQSLLEADNVVGHGIRKAYLSKSRITKLAPGDILFFYRSIDAGAITSIGVVERALRSDDAQQVAGAVAKRTVYSIDEINAMATGGMLAVLFRHARHLPAPVGLADLLASGALKGAPQSFGELDETAFAKIRDRLAR